ncbi:MAG TPA: hypothetical protein VFS96_02930 [Nitrolancea sp.]|nr:hypothetical protein [Nitrolancea sp.]
MVSTLSAGSMMLNSPSAAEEDSAAFPKPWDMDGLREALVSYALIGLRDEWESLEQREAQIEAQMQQLEAQPTNNALRRFVVSDTARYLHEERESLIRRREEIKAQWQSLHAEQTGARILIEPRRVVTTDEDAHLSSAFKAVMAGIFVGAPVGGLAGLGLMALVMSATMGWLMVGVYAGVAAGTLLGGVGGRYTQVLASEAQTRSIPLFEGAA